jgi:hypothetical protein
VVLVAPFVVAVLVCCLQVLLVAWAAVAAADASRAAARAAEVGGDPRRAALTALPAVLRAGAVVSSRAPFSVHVWPPRLVPGIDIGVSG